MRSKSRNERTIDNTSNKEIVFSSNGLEIILLFLLNVLIHWVNSLATWNHHHHSYTVHTQTNASIFEGTGTSYSLKKSGRAYRNIGKSHSWTVNLGILDPSRSGTFVLYVGPCYVLTRYFIEIMINIDWSVKTTLLRLRTLRVMSSHIAIIFHLCPDS